MIEIPSEPIPAELNIYISLLFTLLWKLLLLARVQIHTLLISTEWNVCISLPFYIIMEVVQIGKAHTPFPTPAK